MVEYDKKGLEASLENIERLHSKVREIGDADYSKFSDRDLLAGMYVFNDISNKLDESAENHCALCKFEFGTNLSNSDIKNYTEAKNICDTEISYLWLEMVRRKPETKFLSQMPPQNNISKREREK